MNKSSTSHKYAQQTKATYQVIEHTKFDGKAEHFVVKVSDLFFSISLYLDGVAVYHCRKNGSGWDFLDGSEGRTLRFVRNYIKFTLSLYS